DTMKRKADIQSFFKLKRIGKSEPDHVGVEGADKTEKGTKEVVEDREGDGVVVERNIEMDDKELERSEKAEEIQHEVSEEVEEKGLREEESSDIEREGRELQTPAPCVSGAHAQRGHRESPDSDRQGVFLAMLDLLGKHDPTVKKRLEQQAKNAKYTSRTIQNELLACLAEMVKEEIMQEVKESVQFSVIVDETKDVQKKEQMSIVLRYYYNGFGSSCQRDKKAGFCSMPSQGPDCKSYPHGGSGSYPRL
ncbi:hypothetical protein QQF64_026038, partial [Cirrhinus molitorella]